MKAQPTVRQRDLGYACFLVVGAASLLSTLAEIIDAGLLLVALWLFFFSLVTVPIGIFLSIVCWRDGLLPALSVLTLAFVVEGATEAGSVRFYNASTSLYGVLVLLIVASWFGFRRWRVNPAHPAKHS